MTDALLDALLASVELAVIFSLLDKGMMPLPLCLLFTLGIAIPVLRMMRPYLIRLRREIITGSDEE